VKGNKQDGLVHVTRSSQYVIGPYLEENKLMSLWQEIVMQGSKVPTKVRIFTSHRHQEGELSP